MTYVPESCANCAKYHAIFKKKMTGADCCKIMLAMQFFLTISSLRVAVS